MKNFLAIDQGTTSSRAIIFNSDLQPISESQKEYNLSYPKDGWVELDKSYTCLFMQQWGLMNSSHQALLVQVIIDEEIYGNKDGKIEGDFNDFLELTRVVDAAMGQL